MGFRYFKVLIILGIMTSILGIQTLYEGNKCSIENIGGTCKKISDCPNVIQNLKNIERKPTICSFEATNLIVCCPTLEPASTSVSNNSNPTVIDISNSSYHLEKCPPLDSKRTTEKTGRKAWDKCIEYQELVFPCEEFPPVTLLSGHRQVVRSDNCVSSTQESIVGSDTFVRLRELPHMVLLGFEDPNNNGSLNWMCSGTLISDRFILTAAHCTYSREYGTVSSVGLGVIKVDDPEMQLYKVAEIIKHPDFKPIRTYNDIALIKTDRNIVLNRYIIPACVNTAEQVEEMSAFTSGLGTELHKDHDQLRKLELNKFSTEECKSKLQSDRRLKLGFQEDKQMCYGLRKDGDRCQGDAGGPLQILNKNVYCMFTVIGVTSMAKPCFSDEPGLYTRVAKYTTWIESIVWP